MVGTTQGFAALLDVYVRQYRAQVNAELNRVKCNYRTVDNIAIIDKDITALAQVCTQADKLLIQGGDDTTTTYSQARMISMLVGANAAALKIHMPMVSAADLRFITGPNVAVLDQARLKASAKRLLDIDDAFIANVDSTVATIQNALAATFPKPQPQPDRPAQPDPSPMPVPDPDPLPEPEPDPDPDPEPDPEPMPQPDDLHARNFHGGNVFENQSVPTGPADMFDTPPSPLDQRDPPGSLAMPNVPDWLSEGEDTGPVENTLLNKL